MDRKKFLTTAGLAAFALSACGSVKPISAESKTNAPAGSKFVGDCNTTNDILGPFYRPNAPTRSNLITNGISGTVVTLKGKVFKADCVTPLKNALVEIWHCNTKGEYDNETNKFDQRAKWVTNDEGEYSFTTILPGKYLNGKLFRPAHIHFRVNQENSKELISQIYFKGDPHITEDPWASQSKAELRVLPISLEDVKGNLSVIFDIYLSDK